MTARRLARWLRLVVACLAFVLGNPTPAVAADVADGIVLVATDDGGSEEATVETATAARHERAGSDVVVLASDSPRLVSRRWLANCALLL